MGMGQHKHNPTAIAAKNGELPPKPKRLSKRQRDRLLMKMIYEKTGIGAIERKLGINSFKEAEMMEDLLRR
jgi:hypothetical protein